MLSNRKARCGALARIGFRRAESLRQSNQSTEALLTTAALISFSISGRANK